MNSAKKCIVMFVQPFKVTPRTARKITICVNDPGLLAVGCAHCCATCIYVPCCAPRHIGSQGALGLLVYAPYPQIPLLEVVLATGAPRDWKSRVRTLPGSVRVEASAIKHLRARLHCHWHFASQASAYNSTRSTAFTLKHCV